MANFLCFKCIGADLHESGYRRRFSRPVGDSRRRRLLCDGDDRRLVAVFPDCCIQKIWLTGESSVRFFRNKPAWAKGDFWAPEIAEDKGKFYVFYTARRDEGKGKKGTLCVAVAVADKPDGNYIDKGALVCQEMGSIDAFFIRDENDKPFLVWKEDGNDRQQPTWMYAQQLDETLTKLIGKPKKLFRNEGSGWENHVVEGADIVRKNGYFYMFYSGNACCGRGCNYAMGVARSKTLLGKWEKNPANPILAANDVWQCPGSRHDCQNAGRRGFSALSRLPQTLGRF